MPEGISPPPVATTTDPFGGLQFHVTQNHTGLRMEDLFGVARRINVNRKALFVSRVLGKHVPVPPTTVRLVALALADRVAAVLGSPPPAPFDLAAAIRDPQLATAVLDRRTAEPFEAEAVTVFGYAETATALGHLVRDGLGAPRYLHSTRREAGGRAPVLRFEEAHSHAPSHAVFHRDPAVLAGDDTVVLVDDELTTGRTVGNTIAAIHALHPRRRYVVAALLDWRPTEDRRATEELATTLGTCIDTVALVTGTVEGDLGPGPAMVESPLGVAEGPAGTAEAAYHEIAALGPPSRLGWDEHDQRALESALPGAAASLARLRGGGPALCLGTEEYMYVPLRIAAALGPGVSYQSTTRSPITAVPLDGYPVRTVAAFPDPIDVGRQSFLYNLAPRRYDDIFVFLDEAVPRAQLAPMVAALTPAATGRVHVVTCGAPR